MNSMHDTALSIALATALALSTPALAQTAAPASQAAAGSPSGPAGNAQMHDHLHAMRQDAEDCMMGDEVTDSDRADMPPTQTAPGMMGMSPGQGMAPGAQRILPGQGMGPGMARMTRGMGMRGEACDMPRGGMMQAQGKPGMKMHGCRMMGGCMADKRLDALEKRLDMMQMMLEMMMKK